MILEPFLLDEGLLTVNVLDREETTAAEASHIFLLFQHIVQLSFILLHPVCDSG